MDDWQPVPPTPAPPRPEVRRNSPVAIVGVLGLVLATVLALAMAGRVRTAVPGVPVAAPDVITTTVADAPPTGAAGAPGAAAPHPRPVVALENNPLLTPGMPLPAVTCRLPAFGRGAEQLKAYYQAMVGCLDEAWKPVLTQVNEPFEPPGLSVADQPDSSCGTPGRQEAVAFYCPRDRTIFMPRDRVIESMGSSQASHIMVLAHEYGHHVQALSGINNGFGVRVGPLAEDSPEYEELTRRMELQADCFSGMFIAAATGRGSITKAVGNAAAGAFRNSVADKSHGSVKHQIQWGTTGVKKNNTAACNTWLAPAGEVS